MVTQPLEPRMPVTMVLVRICRDSLLVSGAVTLKKSSPDVSCTSSLKNDFLTLTVVFWSSLMALESSRLM